MSQRWCDLLFAHWPVPAAALRPLIPARLEIDTFDGTAWPAAATLRINSLLDWIGLAHATEREPHLLFARSLAVRVWPSRKVGNAGG